MKTEIIRIADSFCGDDGENGELIALSRAAEIIRSGGLVVFPTETVYGLGGDATNPKASQKIYSAKGRPSDNPLIIHISEPSDAEKYAFTNDVYHKLAKAFMPGPLTVVLDARESVPKETRGGLDTVAVRCPSNPIARELIKLSGVAIAAPSANLSGSPSPTTARHAIDDMLNRVDMIIDGGDCDFGLESTIVKIKSDGSLCLLRPGKITIEDLSQIAPVEVADAVTDKLREGEIAQSPGMKYRHYAPRAQVVLLDGSRQDAINYIEKAGQSNIGVLCYTDESDKYREAFPDASLYLLGASDDETEQAHRLFALLRDADKAEHSIIYAPLPARSGIGLALYNRLIRAAAHTIINLTR